METKKFEGLLVATAYSMWLSGKLTERMEDLRKRLLQTSFVPRKIVAARDEYANYTAFSVACAYSDLTLGDIIYDGRLGRPNHHLMPVLIADQDPTPTAVVADREHISKCLCMGGSDYCEMVKHGSVFRIKFTLIKLPQVGFAFGSMRIQDIKSF